MGNIHHQTMQRSTNGCKKHGIRKLKAFSHVFVVYLQSSSPDSVHQPESFEPKSILTCNSFPPLLGFQGVEFEISPSGDFHCRLID